MFSEAPYRMTSPEMQECKHRKINQLLVKNALSFDQGFSFSCHSQRKNLELSDKSNYYDMHLSLPVNLEMLTGTRRLQKSLDFQEFEFDMSSTGSHVLEPEEVAPADDLFYKGQLLPFQQDPRLQLVQTLSSKIITDEQVNEDQLQEVFSCALREENMKFNSCRFDGPELENGLIDSGCSSFHSQGSHLWEKETEDSSSSRDSNGSSHDSSYSGGKETPINTATENFQSDNSQYCKAQNQSGKRSYFNWKSILHNFRKAPKQWTDDRVENHKSTSTNIYHDARQKQHLFYFHLRTSSKPKGTERTSSARDYNSTSIPSSKWVDPVDGEDGQKVTTSWNSKKSWRKYVRKLKPLHMRMTQKHPESGMFGQLSMEDCGGASVVNNAISFSRSPLERKQTQSASYRNANHPYSSRYLTAASCPASMWSSPNHSAVLTVIDKGCSISTMQELQSAVQSAIAHCKQSQAGNLVA